MEDRWYCGRERKKWSLRNRAQKRLIAQGLPGLPEIRRRGRLECGTAYFTNMKFARCVDPSLNVTTSCRQVLAHDRSVFHTKTYWSAAAS